MNLLGKFADLLSRRKKEILSAMTNGGIPRRSLLAGVAGAAVLGVTAACNGDDEPKPAPSLSVDRGFRFGGRVVAREVVQERRQSHGGVVRDTPRGAVSGAGSQRDQVADAIFELPMRVEGEVPFFEAQITFDVDSDQSARPVTGVFLLTEKQSNGKALLGGAFYVTSDGKDDAPITFSDVGGKEISANIDGTKPFRLLVVLDKAGSGKGLVVVSTEDGSPVFEMPLNHTDYTKFSMQSSGVDGREARWTFASGVPGSMDRDLFATLWSGDRDVKVDLLTKIVGDARKHDPMDPAFAQSLEPSPLST